MKPKTSMWTAILLALSACLLLDTFRILVLRPIEEERDNKRAWRALQREAARIRDSACALPGAGFTNGCSFLEPFVQGRFATVPNAHGGFFLWFSREESSWRNGNSSRTNMVVASLSPKRFGSGRDFWDDGILFLSMDRVPVSKWLSDTNHWIGFPVYQMNDPSTDKDTIKLFD